jgi:hypothetical protein
MGERTGKKTQQNRARPPFRSMSLPDSRRSWAPVGRRDRLEQEFHTWID